MVSNCDKLIPNDDKENETKSMDKIQLNNKQTK